MLSSFSSYIWKITACRKSQMFSLFIPVSQEEKPPGGKYVEKIRVKTIG